LFQRRAPSLLSCCVAHFNSARETPVPAALVAVLAIVGRRVILHIGQEPKGRATLESDGGARLVVEGAHPRAYSHRNHKLRSLT